MHLPEQKDNLLRIAQEAYDSAEQAGERAKQRSDGRIGPNKKISLWRIS